MHDIIEQFLSLPTTVFCLVVFLLVWFQRKGLELAIPALTDPKSKWSKIWREFLVPIAPVGTGALIGIFVAVYPYPEIFANSWQARMFFGAVCGGGSGLGFIKIVWKNILEKISSKETRII